MSSHSIGSKIRITTVNEMFEGILESFTVANSCHHLEKAFRITNNYREFVGELNIFPEEIKKLEEVNQAVHTMLPTPTITNPDLDEILKNFTVNPKDALPKHNDKDNQDETDTESEISVSEDDILLEEVREADEYFEYRFEMDCAKLPFPASNKVLKVGKANQACIIDEICSSSSIGIAACGDNVSRFGKIDFLLVSGNVGNYVFEHEFIDTLKSVLESRRILKIFHGGRYFIDTLYRVYNINLCGVFDTQVAHFYVRKHEVKKDPKNWESYERCLAYYFNYHAPNDKKRYKQLSRDILSASVESYVRRQVMFLRSLYFSQTNRLLYEVSHCMEIYSRGLLKEDDHAYSLVTEDDESTKPFVNQKRLTSSYNPRYIEEIIFAQGHEPNFVNIPNNGTDDLPSRTSKGTQTCAVKETKTHEIHANGHQEMSEDSEKGKSDSSGESSGSTDWGFPNSNGSKSTTPSSDLEPIYIRPRPRQSFEGDWPVYTATNSAQNIRCLPAGAESFNLVKY